MMARPLIGPKVQTQVPHVVKAWAKRRAEKDGLDEAAVIRELVLAGYEVIVNPEPSEGEA